MMIKEDSCKIKFERLVPWTTEIFQLIKKDLKNEHLLKTPAFVQKHFPKRALDRLTTEEMAAAYLKEMSEGDEELGEKVITRWVMKNAELYQFFVTELSKINPKFDEIESFAPEMGSCLFRTSVAQFGAIPTYIFCVMNAVVFAQEQMQTLRELALAAAAQPQSQVEKNVFESVDAVKQHYEKELRKLMEKYEKRLQGLERKYFQDMEGFKKQIAHLHRKMGGGGVA